MGNVIVYKELSGQNKILACNIAIIRGKICGQAKKIIFYPMKVNYFTIKNDLAKFTYCKHTNYFYWNKMKSNEQLLYDYPK